MSEKPTTPICSCFTYAGDNPNCPVHHPKHLNDTRKLVLITLADIARNVETNKNALQLGIKGRS